MQIKFIARQVDGYRTPYPITPVVRIYYFPELSPPLGGSPHGRWLIEHGRNHVQHRTLVADENFDRGTVWSSDRNP